MKQNAIILKVKGGSWDSIKPSSYSPEFAAMIDSGIRALKDQHGHSRLTILFLPGLCRMKMDSIVKHYKPVVILLIAAALILFYASPGHETITEKSFVGKWKSSRLATPIYLYANGEWEIKKDDGAILQYGVWQYLDNKILWSYKLGSHIGHDSNAILSASSREFQVQESDRTTTTFTRLDEDK